VYDVKLGAEMLIVRNYKLPTYSVVIMVCVSRRKTVIPPCGELRIRATKSSDQEEWYRVLLATVMVGICTNLFPFEYYQTFSGVRHSYQVSIDSNKNDKSTIWTGNLQNAF